MIVLEAVVLLDKTAVQVITHTCRKQGWGEGCQQGGLGGRWLTLEGRGGLRVGLARNRGSLFL